MSFEEKSVWVQLVVLLGVLGGYVLVAGAMLGRGVTAMGPYVAVFAVATVVIIAAMIVGHIIAAILSRGETEDADERDRLIGWRAESNASWVLGLGVIGSLWLLALGALPVYVGHVLVVSLFASEILKLALAALYYRKGL